MSVCVWRKQWECVRRHYAFHFSGNPRWLSAPKEGLPKPLALNSALLGHHLQSGDRGRVSLPQMWQQWEFLGLRDVISASYAVCCMGWSCMCVYVCLDRQTGCDGELRGGGSQPREESKLPNKFKRNDGANSVNTWINLLITFTSGHCVYHQKYDWLNKYSALVALVSVVSSEVWLLFAFTFTSI